ncbi:hypothetical protein B0T18DRAFT_401398 [Schizothecium vesticola]|uniref:Uncharacterized protein n=1 Tax=Schizothecium vesticola TaxID=314040 RepID=A0AA40F470_9PEZI|nr:hypothetical protein B0T18DRAFT_401398 [Schizothecium vesticola]
MVEQRRSRCLKVVQATGGLAIPAHTCRGVKITCAAEPPSTDSHHRRWTRCMAWATHHPRCQLSQYSQCPFWETGRLGDWAPSNVSIPCPATHLPASTVTPNDRGGRCGYSRSALPRYLPGPGNVPSSAHAGPLRPWTVSPTSLPRSTYTRDRRPTFAALPEWKESARKPARPTTEQGMEGRSRGEPTRNPDLPCRISQLGLSLSAAASSPCRRGPGY